MFLTDCYGNITVSYVQEGFGNVLATSGSLTSKQQEPETGLYYFYARWYDPVVGRFISRSVLPTDIEHPYVYCSNDPLNHVDPNGQFFVCAKVLIVIAICVLGAYITVNIVRYFCSGSHPPPKPPTGGLPPPRPLPAPPPQPPPPIPGPPTLPYM